MAGTKKLTPKSSVKLIKTNFKRSPGQQRRKLDRTSLNKIIPNLATLSALCVGLSAVKFAMQGRFEWAVASTLIAGLIDGLDGKLARILKAESHFGAELDSFSDFINFGVAPALTLYICILQKLGGLGWIAVLFFSVCMALRLARFNTRLVEQEGTPVWGTKFNTGVPAPAGAFLCLLPLMAHFAIESTWPIYPLLVALNMVMVGSLMVSRWPTYSPKTIEIPEKYTIFVLTFFCLMVAALISSLWETLIVVGIVYIITLPFSLRSARRMIRAQVSSPPTE